MLKLLILICYFSGFIVIVSQLFQLSSRQDKNHLALMRKSAPQPWRDASSFSLIYTLPCPVRCPHCLVSGYGALGLGGLGLCNK